MFYTAPLYFPLYGLWLAADLQMKLLNACFAVAAQKSDAPQPDILPPAIPQTEAMPV